MPTPVTTFDQQYSDPAATAVAWEETRRVLETAELFWVSTVRADGRPHVTPVVAAWAEEALWFSTGAGEQKFAATPTAAARRWCSRSRPPRSSPTPRATRSALPRTGSGAIPARERRAGTDDVVEQGGFPAGSESPGTSGSSITAAQVLTQSSAGCSAQRGRDLQLGVQVSNQSATAAIVRDVRAVLPLGGLRAVGQQWAPCGALPGGQYPAGNRLSPGGSIWVTFTFAVLVRCPRPFPVQFAVNYDWRGQREAARLPGFPDLGEVPYSGCRTR